MQTQPTDQELKRQCSWCSRLMAQDNQPLDAKPDADDKNITHSICAECESKVSQGQSVRVFAMEDPTPGAWAAFIAAMHTGHEVEIDEEMFYYWLEVLPPIFMGRKLKYTPANSDTEIERVCSFGFAEGAEPITVFWSTGEVESGYRYFCQRTKTMNPNA
jgi:uncharacterized protein YlaI